jgi:hypothetical protein
MTNRPVTRDDLQDVMEMTQKLEEYISRVLGENETQLAMAALMNASVNSIIAQCRSFEEVSLYRSLLINYFNLAVDHIEFKNP